MNKPSLQEQIDSLQLTIQQEIIPVSLLVEQIKQEQARHLEAIKALADFRNQAHPRIGELIDQLNRLTVEMDKQIQFQHWFFAEMDRPDDAPFVPFEPQPIKPQPILKIVK